MYRLVNKSVKLNFSVVNKSTMHEIDSDSERKDKQTFIFLLFLSLSIFRRKSLKSTYDLIISHVAQRARKKNLQFIDHEIFIIFLQRDNNTHSLNGSEIYTIFTILVFPFMNEKFRNLFFMVIIFVFHMFSAYID